MVQQQLLPIKMKRSDEQITPLSGLILFDEFINVFVLTEAIAKYMLFRVRTGVLRRGDT
jgi:hypothetical protein